MGRKIQTPNLTDTLAGYPELTLFSQMLAASGIDEMFAEGGEFTIFAPTNRAFERLPPRRLLTLLYQSDRTNVRNLVLFHVTPGRLLAREAKFSDADHPSMYIMIESLRDYIGEPGLRRRNIEASNGVIHEIGFVLAPAREPAEVY
jgi:uncharacterized surface protein with fasciclin (FAS1) repeats